MRKPTFSQAATLVRLVSESGMNLELVQRVLIERWDVVLGFVRCLHAGVINELTLSQYKDMGSSRPAETARQHQPKRYYDLGWRSALEIKSYTQYFYQCPEVPEELQSYDQDFPYLLLVDERPGLQAMCAMLKVDVSKVNSITGAGSREPYWIRCQDGWRYRDRRSFKVQKQLNYKREASLTLAEALCLAAQYPRALRDIDIDILENKQEGNLTGYVLTKESGGAVVLFESPYVSEMESDPRCGLATKKVFSSG